jgi:hypothetical protein
VWVRGDKGWARLEQFEAPARVREDRAPTLRDWRQPLTMGTDEATAGIRQRDRGPRWWWRVSLAYRILTRR